MVEKDHDRYFFLISTTELPFPYNSWPTILSGASNFSFYPLRALALVVALRTKITTENHQNISFHFTYVYEGPISHSLLSPSLNHIFWKYINMLFSHLLIGAGCFPVPCTYCNVSNYNNYMSVYYRVCVFCSYVLCSLKCATLCIQMLMCFKKLLWLDFDLTYEWLCYSYVLSFRLLSHAND